MTGQETDADGQPVPPVPLPWYERGTLLTNDLTIALEYLHWPLPTYYAQTSPRERLLYRLYFAAKAARQEFADEASRRTASRDALAPPRLLER